MIGLVEILTKCHLGVVLVGDKRIVVTDNCTRSAGAILMNSCLHESFPTVRRGLTGQSDTGIRRGCQHAFSTERDKSTAGGMRFLHLLNQCENVLTCLGYGIKELIERVCGVELPIGSSLGTVSGLKPIILPRVGKVKKNFCGGVSF